MFFKKSTFSCTKSDIHSVDNTRVTDTRCVQYMLQRSVVTSSSTHSHTKSTLGQHYSIFGQQYSTVYLTHLDAYGPKICQL